MREPEDSTNPKPVAPNNPQLPGHGIDTRVLFRVLLAMVAVLVLAAAFTLSSIEKTMPPVLQFDPEASPLGYTRSLTLVYLPILVLLWWFRQHPEHDKADWTGLKHTLYFLVPLWSAVDIFAAATFFRFPNCKSTLEWYVPGWLPGQGFSGRVPIEEFFFYLGGSLLFLLLYMWSKAVWFPRTAPTASLRSRARASIPAASFRWRDAAGVLVIVALATAYKWIDGTVAPQLLEVGGCKVPQTATDGVGFPLYLTLLLIVAVGPMVVLWRKMVPLINLQAMLLAAVTGLLVSLMWEVTLALPYGWWDYNSYWMTGIYIKPWYSLPLEAAVLWLCAGMGSIILFELFRAQYAAATGFWRFLFGPAESTDDQGSSGAEHS